MSLVKESRSPAPQKLAGLVELYNWINGCAGKNSRRGIA